MYQTYHLNLIHLAEIGMMAGVRKRDSPRDFF